MIFNPIRLPLVAVCCPLVALTPGEVQVKEAKDALLALRDQQKPLKEALASLQRRVDFNLLALRKWQMDQVLTWKTSLSKLAEIDPTFAQGIPTNALPLAANFDDFKRVDDGFQGLLEQRTQLLKSPSAVAVKGFLDALTAWHTEAGSGWADVQHRKAAIEAVHATLNRVFKVLTGKERKAWSGETPGRDQAIEEDLVRRLADFLPQAARERVEQGKAESDWGKAFLEDDGAFAPKKGELATALGKLPLQELTLLAESAEDHGLDPVALACIREARYLLGRYFDGEVANNPLAATAPDRVRDDGLALSWYRYAAALNHADAERAIQRISYPLVVLDLMNPDWDGNRAWSFHVNDGFTRSFLTELSHAQAPQSIREFLFRNRGRHARRWLTQEGTFAPYRIAVLVPKGKKPDVAVKETPRQVLAIRQMKLVMQRLDGGTTQAVVTRDTSEVAAVPGQNDLLLGLDDGDVQKVEGVAWDAYFIPARTNDLRATLDLGAHLATDGDGTTASKGPAASLATITGSREWFFFTLNQSVSEFTVKDRQIQPRGRDSRIFLGFNVLPFKGGDAMHDRNGWGNLGLHVGGLVDSAANKFTRTYFVGLSYRMPDLSTQFPKYAPLFRPLSALVFTAGPVWERDAVDAAGKDATRQGWRFMIGFNLDRGLAAFLKE